MNAICGRLGCKYNRENNALQKLRICGKETIKISKRGFCQSKVKAQ